VQEPDVEGGDVQVDDLIDWVALGAHHLVNGRQVRPGFHLDDRVAFAIEHVHILCVLQECAAHADDFLVVQHARQRKVRDHVRGGETVAEQVRVLAVLVVHDVANQHVAHAGVERCRLANHVDALHTRDVLADLRQKVIRRHSEWVVDVDDDGVAVQQRLHAIHAAAHQPRIDRVQV